MSRDSAVARIRSIGARLASRHCWCSLRSVDGDDRALTGELAGPNERARLQAAIAIDEMGPKARPARSVLEAAREDGNDYVRRVVRHALSVGCIRKCTAPFKL